jgi:aryl-alcohol dehydrogenase-like predicted oxidoreductase
VHPIVDVQIEYSLVSRGPERRLFPALRELGIGATLYGVLCRGLLSGKAATGPSDFRSYLPRFAGANAEQNARVVNRFQAFATERGLSPGQLSVAYVLARQPGFVPIVGARTREQLEDVLGALPRPLAAADVTLLESIVPPDALAGTRYAAEQMEHLDSER